MNCGHSALTRTPRVRARCARDLEKSTTAALVAEYTGAWGMGKTPPAEATLTTEAGASGGGGAGGGHGVDREAGAVDDGVEVDVDDGTPVLALAHAGVVEAEVESAVSAEVRREGGFEAGGIGHVRHDHLDGAIGVRGGDARRRLRGGVAGDVHEGQAGGALARQAKAQAAADALRGGRRRRKDETTRGRAEAIGRGVPARRARAENGGVRRRGNGGGEGEGDAYRARAGDQRRLPLDEHREGGSAPRVVMRRRPIVRAGGALLRFGAVFTEDLSDQI